MLSESDYQDLRKVMKEAEQEIGKEFAIKFLEMLVSLPDTQRALLREFLDRYREEEQI